VFDFAPIAPNTETVSTYRTEQSVKLHRGKDWCQDWWTASMCSVGTKKKWRKTSNIFFFIQAFISLFPPDRERSLPLDVLQGCRKTQLVWFLLFYYYYYYYFVFFNGKAWIAMRQASGELEGKSNGKSLFFPLLIHPLYYKNTLQSVYFIRGILRPWIKSYSQTLTFCRQENVIYISLLSPLRRLKKER